MTALVLDPELDKAISMWVSLLIAAAFGPCGVALRLPTSWCAIGFAYLREDVWRRSARQLRTNFWVAYHPEATF